VTTEPTTDFADEEILSGARRVISIEAAALGYIAQRLGGSYVRAEEAIRRTIDAGGKVLVLGVGKSAHIGQKIASTFASVGCVAVVLDSLNALHGDVGIVKDGDLVLTLSYRGETDELVKILSVLRRLEVQIVTLTGAPRSTAAQLSDVVVDVSVEQEACPLNLAPTASTTAMLAVGDALAMGVLTWKGFGREDFSKHHPAGGLGRALLTRVGQIMRSRDEITVVAEGDSIRSVLKAMSEKKNGAAVIEAANSELIGIFTHGDFARHFDDDSNIGTQPVGLYMTRNPLTVGEDSPAVEVISLLRQHRVDEIVVTDTTRRVVGVVDVQDLARHRLV